MPTDGPDMAQLGNEISNGMLRPDGNAKVEIDVYVKMVEDYRKQDR